MLAFSFLTYVFILATLELMIGAEVMRPRGDIPPPIEGGAYKPPLLEPTSTPHTLFQEHQPTPPTYELPLQKETSERLLHLFGSDYTPAIGLRSLRERGRLLREKLDFVRKDGSNGENFSMETLSEIGDRTACIRITAALIATRYEINLQDHIEKKLLNKMQIKYRPDDVTEIRIHGTPEDPGRKDGPYSLAYLKGTFDEKTGVQHYQNRGLPIPEEENHRREQTRKFKELFQDLSNWWQIRGLGSDLIPLERADNLVDDETGEITEVIGVFKHENGSRMSNDEINRLSRENVSDLRVLEALGDELADVFIGTYCTDAGFGIDSDVKDKERMDIAVEKYGDGPKLRKAGHPLDVRLKHMDEKYKREKMGLRPPDPLPTIVWESNHRRRSDKVSHKAGNIHGTHAA